MYNQKPTVVRRVISEETSKTVCSILEKVVGDSKDGTGKNAAVAGYRIGGKTGTSEKVSLEAETGKKEYIVSFLGFAPADDPQIAILVLLDSPSSKSGIYISGGQMAAPTVGKMFTDILPYMGIVPQYTEQELKVMDKTVPDVSGMSADKAEKKLAEAGFSMRLIGDGGYITNQLPAAGAEIADGSTILAYASAKPSDAERQMPDLRGLSYTDARNILCRYGVFLGAQGYITDPDTQLIESQSIPVGSSVPYGTIVRVTFTSDDSDMLGRY